MESGASSAARDREARLEAARAALEASLRGGAGLHLNACVRCGLCGETCHVYLAEPVPENLPVAKAGAVAAFYRRQATLLGRIAARLVRRARDHARGRSTSSPRRCTGAAPPAAAAASTARSDSTSPR